MLNNLFKVKAKNFWHHLLHAYADVISFLLQGNVKSKKMTKIAKIKEKKCPYLLSDLMNLKEIFRKMQLMKPELHPLARE